MGRLIALTARVMNGQTYTKPRVVYVNEELIIVEPGGSASSRTKVTEKLTNGDKNIFEVYEKAMEVESARNPVSTDLYLKAYVASALAGAGTTQGAGTALAKYLNEALTIGAGATEAFTLPAATVGKVVVVLSNDAAGDAAKVFPAVGEFINAQAVNTVYSVPAGSRAHFVCLATGYWTVAEDFGQR
jgi:hypothetical protein